MPEKEKEATPLTIFVLCDKIPTDPQPGVKQVVNYHGELGYYLKQHEAEAQAKRKTMHVIQLEPGEVLS